MISYSQPATKQDLWVINRLSFLHAGYFVEIGAHDGIRHSNTKMLEDFFGWRGLLVEPQRPLYHKLIANRCRQNEFSSVVVGPHDDAEVGFFLGDSYGGIIQYMPADWQEEHRRRRTITDTKKSVTLNTLLEQHRCPQYIDYLSLDVEGAELPILEKLDYAKYSFGIITVEFRYDDVLLARLEDLLEPYYRLEKVQAFDAFFVNKNLATVTQAA